MNPHVEQLAIPYQQSMMFLSYIRGPLVNDWVEEQALWLIDQVTRGVPHAEENLWATIETRFRQAYTDTAEKQKAQHNIRDLKMKGDDLDGFIAQFTMTAKKARCYVPSKTSTATCDDTWCMLDDNDLLKAPLAQQGR